MKSPSPQTGKDALTQFLIASACLAICVPAWLAFNVAPSATFVNQAMALLGWGVFIGLSAACLPTSSETLKGASRRVTAMVVLLGIAVMASSLWARLPTSLALSSLGFLFAAFLTTWIASISGAGSQRPALFQAFSLALLLAATLSVFLALIQYFAPQWTGTDWIARIATQGRAGGNLRQPNHLSSLLLWAMAALVWLHETRAEREATPEQKTFRIVTTILMAALTFGVVLTVSRTGTVCIVLLALWGVVDKRLSRYSRVLLWLTPLVYALCWMALGEFAQASGHDFAGNTQLHKSDPSSSRFAIWANVIELIKQNPWFGVGWGEFNFAWTLTPFPGRPTAFFDHTHNLLLQFLVELGIPLGTLVLALLAWSLWKAFAACLTAPEADRSMVRTAFVMVLMMVVHSMLEYPLWYAYFLLPTAFALGICLGHAGPSGDEQKDSASPPNKWLRPALITASIVLMIGSIASVVDYMRVVAIFSVSDDAAPLSQRIAEGQKSWFFAHHADYAAATVAEHPSDAMKAFQRAPHYLLDTRLMMAWAKAYNERGDVERARYIAQRLKEFRNPDSAEFFAECDAPRPAGLAAPFQCSPPTRSFTYQDFKMRSN